MQMKHLGIVLICASQMACVSAPRVKTEVVRIKPDPTWVQNYPIPIRNGETLGDYYDWSFELYQLIQRVNINNEAAREFYDMPSPTPD